MRGAWSVWSGHGWLALALLTAGCVAVTINVTFPQEEIDTAASSIEDLVRSPSPPPAKDGAPGRGGAAPAATIVARWSAALEPRAAEAQEPELKTRTPEVLAVIESRRGRYPALAAALASGCLGENNLGLVEARPGGRCPADSGALASAENRDRMVLYRTLVEQNHMPPADITRVQAGFARANRDKAPAGTWVQDERGQWMRK
jgi:uncharacterized protein YdbL (DUF1318 family)